MNKDELMPGWFRCTEYFPAIELALNNAAGGLTVHDILYWEENDSYYVELSDTSKYYGDRGYYDMGFRLDGKLVRSCFKAVEKGVNLWTETGSWKKQ
jgi:hypothetical protein